MKYFEADQTISNELKLEVLEELTHPDNVGYLDIGLELYSVPGGIFSREELNYTLGKAFLNLVRRNRSFEEKELYELYSGSDQRSGQDQPWWSELLDGQPVRFLENCSDFIYH